MISRQLRASSRDLAASQYFHPDSLQTFHSQVTLLIICIDDNQAHDQFLLLLFPSPRIPDGCHNALKIRYDNLQVCFSWDGLASCLPGISRGLGAMLPVNDEGKIIWLKGRGAVIDPALAFFQTSYRCWSSQQLRMNHISIR